MNLWAWAFMGVSSVAVGATVYAYHLLQKLSLSERQYRVLAENTSDVVCLHSIVGDYTYVSPSVQQVLGYPPEALLGRNPSGMVHPDDQAALSTVIREGGILTYRIRHAQGWWLWLETIVHRLKEPQGRSYYQSTSRNVTDRKSAEDLYRSLARSLPDTGVALFDDKLEVLVAEGALFRARGVVEGVTIQHIFLEWGPRFETYFRSALAGMRFRRVIEIWARQYDVRIFPVRVGDERIQAGMLVAVDVSEQVHTQRSLVEKSRALEEMNRDLDQFVDVASHELKSPLRHISSYAEILGSEYQDKLTGESLQYLQYIQEGVAEMHQVLETLLHYSRTKFDTGRMQPTPLAEVVAPLLFLHPEVQVVGEALPSVVGDPVLLRQLFENLISNGLKFAGVHPSVQISCRIVATHWEFSVRDNGPGVDPEHREMIFVMFKRSRPEVEGSGIGLALCKKIVGLHQGRIWVEDAPGGGADFRFTLPASYAPPPLEGPDPTDPMHWVWEEDDPTEEAPPLLAL